MNIDTWHANAMAPQWLHPVIEQAEAEVLVSKGGLADGKFLIRKYGQKKDEYALCVVYRGKPTHHLIKKVCAASPRRPRATHTTPWAPLALASPAEPQRHWSRMAQCPCAPSHARHALPTPKRQQRTQILSPRC